MTIFVDSAFISATVGRVSGRWCHLVSDAYDSAELHPFAASIGLRRAWFQFASDQPHLDCAPPWRWHYDVTESVRVKALAAGAQVMDMHDFALLMDRKRYLFEELSEVDRAEERARWRAIALGTEKWEQEGLF